MRYNIKQKGNKSNRDKSLKRLLESPAIMASGVSKTIILSSDDPDELCNRLNLFLQEKHAGNIFEKITDEIVAIVDEILEYKCISEKQQNQILIKCNLL